MPKTLEDILNGVGEETLTLDELLAVDEHLQSIDASVGTRVSFLRRLKRLNHIDGNQIEFGVFESEDDDPSAVASQLLLEDPIADKAEVTAYMKKVLPGVLPCKGVPNVVQDLADAAMAQVANTNYVAYMLDQHLRVRASVGRVMPHAQRDKKQAPDPIDEDSLIPDIDHRGHLFAANLALDERFADVFLNVIAEHGKVNVGAKKRFENVVAEFAKLNPNTIIHTIHIPYYKAGETRPFAVSHYMAIDNKIVAGVTLFNPDS